MISDFFLFALFFFFFFGGGGVGEGGASLPETTQKASTVSTASWGDLIFVVIEGDLISLNMSRYQKCYHVSVVMSSLVLRGRSFRCIKFMHTVHFAPELIDLRQKASKPRGIYSLIFCNYFYVVPVAFIRHLLHGPFRDFIV